MLFLFGFFVLCGCSNSTSLDNNKGSNVFYEIFVRAFADSDGDGIGDFNGITKNLDYLESLGIEGIWLLPVYPSPSYHGYDITDYYDVNSDYGSLEEFKNLVDEAHKRDIKVILDMVLNHAVSNIHGLLKVKRIVTAHIVIILFGQMKMIIHMILTLLLLMGKHGVNLR